MLCVKDLRISYGLFELRANFSIQTGSLVAILGPSGSGKTTLINAIAGFTPNITGFIEWNQLALAALSPGERPINILFQDHNLFPHLNVEKNVSIGIKPNLKLTALERKSVLETIIKVGLGELGSKQPSELSGGQKTRVALARVMVRCKPLLLLDEAFLGLEPALRLKMLDLMIEYVQKESKTLLMVTHDIDDVIKLGQLVLFVDNGDVFGPMHVTEFLSSTEPRFRKYLGG